MKKRLLSALLALALVFVLLPTTALAGVTTGKEDYDISINGKGWKFDKEDNSDAYIPVYFYGNDPSRYFFSTEANDNWITNSNLMLTKEGNTVTITIRPKKNHIPGNTIEFTLEKKSTTSGEPYDYTPCIEMGNNNNLVITGKGTLNITRDEKNGIGAALCSEVGDITITDGITVKANFLKQVSNSTVGNAISVKDHNLIISGKNTKVEARNSSCNIRDFYDASAAVCVENGEIKVSDGATLDAANSYTNPAGSQYSYYSCAISGDKDAPCTVSVTGENSCIIASAHNSTKHVNTSMGQAYRWAKFKVDGAKIEVGTSSPAQTITDINDISNYKYAKISIPALEKDSYVYIAGENAVVGQWTNIPAAATGTGSYYYDADKKELTLKDVNITHSDGAIVQFLAGAPYIIKLEGTNSIKDVSSLINVRDAYESLDGLSVTISGAGSLEVIARGNAITMLKGNLIFNNTGAITLETTTVVNGKAINVSGDISIGSDFNKNLKITADNGAATFDPTSSYTVYNDLKNYKSISFATPNSTISYGGTTLKQGETIYGETSGTATVDSKNNTITLNNFNGTALSFDATLADSTLVLEGTNTLSSIVTTQKGLTVSGSGSLAAGSIRVTNNDNISADLTITDGAKVTAGTASNTDRAIDITGDLTVTNGSLTATSKSDSVPTVQVGGNASFTGSTVTITNNSTTQGERYKDSYEVSSALHVNGAVTISGGKVMAEAKAGGNAIRAVGNITVSDGATVTAKNNSQYFNAITAGKATGGEVNTLYNLIVSGENTRITATNTHDNNLTYGGAINAYIKNANEGHYLKVGTDTKAIAPNAKTTVRNNSLTITRGDAYETPQVAANYTIAGQTMHVGKYYKTDAKGNITDGTAQDYNIYCDSKNDFTLNNATISSTGTDVAINTNIRYETNVQHHIKLIGTNRINNTFKHAISAGSNSSTIIIEGVGNASDASLTINGNFLPIYSDGKVIINAEVVIVNTTDDNSFKGLISTSDGKGAFDLGSGYKCYASTSTTGTPLEVFNSANYGTYKYLRVTTQTLETGGGSTHQHVWDEAWHDTGDYHHAHQCTICKAYDTTTQELHNVTGHRDNHDGSHSNICGSCGYSAKVSHSYTWAPKANDNEKHIGTCVCGNVVEKNHNFVGDVCQECGYDKSTGTTCEHVWTTEWTIDTVDNEYHWHVCTKCGAIADKKAHAYTIVTDNGTNHTRECECKVFYVEDHISSDWIIDTPATATTAGSMHKECTVCKHKMQTEVIPATGEIEPPTPDNPGTIVIIRPAEEEKPAQQPNPSTGANDLVGLAVAAAVAAALGSAALLRKHD